MKELTPSEIKLAKQISDKYIGILTEQKPEKYVKNFVNDFWQELGWSKPKKIIICDSPIACRERAKKDHKKIDDFSSYFTIWFTGYLAAFEFSEKIGYAIDKEKFDHYTRLINSIPFIFFNEEYVYVSKKLTDVHFNDDNQLHNENGMALKFMDGYGLYLINGVEVDEQIVMAPETQTVKQINKEENEEIKRIRIERFGWEKYLNGINAVLIDENEDFVSGTKEFLFTGSNITALLCICPSTGKEFVLEVPPETKTCADAQDWISGGLAKRIISAS